MTDPPYVYPPIHSIESVAPVQLTHTATHQPRTPNHSMRQLQQLAMEDRRRAAQNSTIGYRVQPKPKEEEEEG